MTDETPASSRAGLVLERLCCEDLINPLGIDVPEPRLSWNVHSFERGQRQTAYQIVAASSPAALANDQADLWDSQHFPQHALHR